MLTFKEHIEVILESVVKTKHKSIKVTKPSRASDQEMVYLNVSNFDKAFKKEKDFYIGKNGSGGISGRYKRFEAFVLGGSEDIGGGIMIDYEPAESIEAAEIYITPEGRVQFTNGRHRYAWLRDNGAKKIPVVMIKESVQNAKKHNLI